MKGRILLVFLTLVFLAGCTSETAPTPPSPGAGSTEQKPRAPSRPAREILCDTTASADDRQRALVELVTEYLQGKDFKTAREQFSQHFQPKGTRLCLALGGVKSFEGLLVQGVGTAESIPALVARPVGSRWTILPLQLEPGGWGRYDSLYIQAAVSHEDRLELVMFVRRVPGGGLQLLHGVSDGNRIAVTRASPRFENAAARFLEDRLVLIEHQGTETGPFAWSPEAIHQSLLRWNGTRYENLGERAFSHPYVTVNLLIGALKANDLSRARLFVTDAGVLEQARTVELAAASRPLNRGNASDPGSQVEEAERANWDRLPEAVRKPYPPGLATCDLTLFVKRGNVTVRLVRKGDLWLVQEILQGS